MPHLDTSVGLAVAREPPGCDDDLVTTSHDSRRQGRPPLRILCQHDHGSCAACCGLYNFADRDDASMGRRLRRRTEAVLAAWPDVDALRQVRDELLAEESPSHLFSGVKVCPYAGYLDVDAGTLATRPPAALHRSARVGCLIHPRRHPEGTDLRDLAVYPRAVCEGHFCAPHEWLRPVEVALAQTAGHGRYGLVVTDAGLVKAITRALTERADGPLRLERLSSPSDTARTSLTALWELLLVDWPWRDPDPRRFGPFFVDGDEARERSLPSCLEANGPAHSTAERTILDAIGTRALGPDAGAALACLREALDEVVVEIQ